MNWTITLAAAVTASSLGAATLILMPNSESVPSVAIKADRLPLFPRAALPTLPTLPTFIPTIIPELPLITPTPELKPEPKPIVRKLEFCSRYGLRRVNLHNGRWKCTR
jgi:hypothetical protein